MALLRVDAAGCADQRLWLAGHLHRAGDALRLGGFLLSLSECLEVIVARFRLRALVFALGFGLSAFVFSLAFGFALAVALLEATLERVRGRDVWLCGCARGGGEEQTRGDNQPTDHLSPIQVK